MNLLNHRRFAKSAVTKSSGTDGDEVPVVPPPRKISKIHPDYFTTNLPALKRFQRLACSTFTYASEAPIFCIRLNSIYDAFKQYRQAAGTGVGNLADPLQDSDVQPQGRDLWSSHFKYYRVLGCQVKITYVSKALASTGQDDAMYNSFVVGYELTDENAPLSDTANMFLMTKRAKRDILGPAETHATVDSLDNVTPRLTKPNVLVQTYNYNPNEWTYHVEEKSVEERWTPIGSSPSIDHELNCRVMHLDDDNPAGGTMSIMVQLNYTVQFREATDSFFKTLDTSGATYPDAEGEQDD